MIGVVGDPELKGQVEDVGQMTMPVAIRPLAIIRLIGVLVISLFLSAALAQQGSLDERLNGLIVTLDRVGVSLSQPDLTDDELRSLEAEAVDAGAQARAIALAHEPVLSDLRARLDQLKPEAGAGEELTPADPLAREIILVENELLAEEAVVNRARAIETRTQQQARQIASILRTQFNQRIFVKTTSFLDPNFWIEATRESSASAASANRILDDIFDRAVSKGPVVLVPVGMLFVAFAFVAVSRLRRRVIALIAKMVGQSEPTDIGKAVTAFLVSSFVTAIPSAAYWTAIYLARAIDALSPSSNLLQGEMGAAILVVSAGFGFTRAILAPGRPAWRIAKIGNTPAIYLSQKMTLLMLFIGLGLILDGLAEQASFATPVRLGSVGLLSLCFAVTIIVAMRRVRVMLAEQSAVSDRLAPGEQFRFARLSAALVALTGCGILGALIFGYLPFAWFLSKQIVWIALILAAFSLIANLLDALGTRYFAPDSAILARVTRREGVNPKWMAQFGIVLTGVLKLLAIIVGLLLIVAPWSSRPVGLVDKATAALIGSEISVLSISLTDIAPIILVFSAGIGLTRVLQSWLRQRYMPLSDLDPGLKTSIVTATGYLGFIAAVAVAFGAVGVDLSRLALVAGALSVGIGFGLQSIVSNFVSGIILLVERPIKAGDWIIAGGEEGTVKKISVRATELQTFDKASVVIPNSDLISGKVKNWVLGSTTGRISIVVGVGYGSDADQVRDILRGCAADHPRVMGYPEPNVLFLDFGDSALVFRLDAYLADVSNSIRTRSDIRFTILKKFREAGIEIPFPQRDLNLRTSEETDALIEKMRGQPGDGSV